MPALPALDELAAMLAALARPARVAIDGVDAAGKTTLVDQLAARIPGARRLSADDFLRPPEERYRRGRESAEGYYFDSFDHERLRSAVLREPGLVLVDGVFLFRPELNDLWTFRIFIRIELEESVRRGIARDGPASERLYRARYAPGQRLYLESVQPGEIADVVLEGATRARAGDRRS